MPKETLDEVLRRASRNIARISSPDQIPRTVIEDMGQGCGRRVRIVYPPGYEHKPVENPQECSDDEKDELSDGATHNID